MNEYDLSEAVTGTVAGALYSSKMALSVSEEMTQRTREVSLEPSHWSSQENEDISLREIHTDVSSVKRFTISIFYLSATN